MREFSQDTLEEADKLFQDKAWITLLTIKNPEGVLISNLCVNTESVVFNNEIYQPTNVTIGEVPQATTGTLPKVPLNIQNVDRIVGQMVEQDPNFGSEWIIGLRVVHENHLGLTPILNPDDTLYEEFIVRDVSTNHQYVTFNLSMGQNPMRIPFPSQKFNPSHCQRTFNNVFTGCPYATSGRAGTNFTFCNKTIESCKERFDEDRLNTNNERVGLPFLGFQGLTRRAIIKV
jgi:phage-related protein